MITIKGQTPIKNLTVNTPAIVRDGLIIHIDAANTSSYSGSGTNVYDLTNNHNDTTLISGVTFDSANMGSFVLNGTSYISTNSSAPFNNTVFTYSGWLLNSAPSLLWNRVLSKKYAFTDLDGYEITLHIGTSTTLYMSGAGSTFGTVETVNWVNTGWHNLVVIYSGTTVFVYVDGAYKGQTAINITGNNARPLYFGKIESEPITQWNGKMSNISIYNRVLSAAEVLQNYNALKARYNKN